MFLILRDVFILKSASYFDKYLYINLIFSRAVNATIQAKANYEDTPIHRKPVTINALVTKSLATVNGN